MKPNTVVKKIKLRGQWYSVSLTSEQLAIYEARLLQEGESSARSYLIILFNAAKKRKKRKQDEQLRFKM